jgi:hypothetical protein
MLPISGWIWVTVGRYCAWKTVNAEKQLRNFYVYNFSYKDLIKM